MLLESVFLVLAYLLIAVIDLFIGFLISEMSYPLGPQSLLLWGTVAAISVGFLLFFIEKTLWFDSLSGGNSRPILVAIFATLLCFAPSAIKYIEGEQLAVQARTNAPLVKNIVKEHFAEIDKNSDGILTEEEFDLFLSEKELEKNVRDLFVYAKSNLSRVGHVIGSYETTITTYTTINNISVPQFHTVTVYVYGISKLDLETLVRRENQYFENW